MKILTGFRELICLSTKRVELFNRHIKLGILVFQEFGGIGMGIQ